MPPSADGEGVREVQNASIGDGGGVREVRNASIGDGGGVREVQNASIGDGGGVREDQNAFDVGVDAVRRVQEACPAHDAPAPGLEARPARPRGLRRPKHLKVAQGLAAMGLIPQQAVAHDFHPTDWEKRAPALMSRRVNREPKRSTSEKKDDPQ